VIAFLGLMVPMMGLTILRIVVLGHTRIGEALAQRIAGEPRDPELQERLLALLEDVTMLRGQVQETQERLDFAERMLARPEPSREPRP
jgi:hypothetical protein